MYREYIQIIADSRKAPKDGDDVVGEVIDDSADIFWCRFGRRKELRKSS